MKENKKYHYCGPVYRFGVVHSEHFEAWTTATSIGRAKANLLMRYKALNGFERGAKFELEPYCLEEEEE